MASITKLAVRGVRAFSPDDDEQCVDFYFPCTVILGQNGCGKTTIIEALKFAITGVFPPGMGRSGNAFIHDPKSVGVSTVKAQIKLQFTSRASQSMLVSRSMELTQRKVKATFKQLDGVLKTWDPDTGERVALSHKCGELDKQIPSLLGVSKAILEHVVFCHQEESSWPLQDPAGLKKRFDDIFDSTKYSKALKSFRDTEKQYVSKAKDLATDVARFSSHKHAAKGFRAELEQQHEKVDVLTEHKRDIDKSVAELDAKIGAVREKLGEIEEADGVIDVKKSEFDQEERLTEEKRRMVEEDLTSRGLKTLHRQMKDFDQNMQAEADRKKDLDSKVSSLEQRIQELHEAERDLSANQGKLQAEKEAHEKKLRTRLNMMERIARVHKLDLTQMTQSQANTSIVASLSQSMAVDDDESVDMTVLTITPDDMVGFFEGLEIKDSELSTALESRKSQWREEETQFNSVLTELGGRLRAMDIEKSRLAGERIKAEEEIRQLKETSSSSRLRKSDVEDHRRAATKAAKERDEAMNDPRRGQIQLEIRQHEGKIDDIKRKVEDESVILDRLKSSAETQNAISTLKEQCEKEIDSLDESIRDDAYALSKFGIEVPESLPRERDETGDELGEAIESMDKAARKLLSEATGRLNQADDDLASSTKQESERSALLGNSQRALATTRTKLQGLSAEANEFKTTVAQLLQHEASIGESYTGNEEDSNELIQYLEKRIAAVEGSMAKDMPKAAKKVVRNLAIFLNDYAAKTLDNKKVDCPCCQTRVPEETVDDFLNGLRDITKKKLYPQHGDDEIAQFVERKSTYQSFRKKLESQKDALREVKRLNQEVSSIEKEVKRLQDELSQFHNIRKKQEQQKKEARSEVNDLRALSESIRRWTDDLGRISEKKQQIIQKQRDVSAAGSTDDRNLRSVEKDLSQLHREKETHATEINRLNREVSAINKRDNDLSTRSMQLENHAREKEKKFAEELKSIERKKELTASVKVIVDDESKIADQIAPLQKKIKKKQTDLERSRELFSADEKELQRNLDAFRRDHRDLKSLSTLIEAYEASSKPEELEKMSARFDLILKEKSDKKAEFDRLKPVLESVMKAVDDQERHKKLLEQNISILLSVERMSELKKEIDALEEQRAEIGGADSLEKYDALAKKKEQLLQEKARTDGLFSSHVEQIRALKRKLSSPEYREVDEQYRCAKIKETTTKLAASDLKKYGNALDKALLQFHGVKIQEINKIIRELWLMTYKGEDITNIEIQSGQEPGSKAAKSYNYRVVMTKGGSKMDMRSRCSAGQRVLTSIVIRLALAETFGINCGCIALDEPTVNLDDENKMGLAVSLAHIIANRSQQRNFQLILITHDEDFIKTLKLELASMAGFSMPEKYFQVSREQSTDGKYYSKIKAKGWEEL